MHGSVRTCYAVWTLIYVVFGYLHPINHVICEYLLVESARRDILLFRVFKISVTITIYMYSSLNVNITYGEKCFATLLNGHVKSVLDSRAGRRFSLHLRILQHNTHTRSHVEPFRIDFPFSPHTSRCDRNRNRPSENENKTEERKDEATRVLQKPEIFVFRSSLRLFVCTKRSNEPKFI